MHNGVFPDNLKVGKITPVFKKGDQVKFENYRPVSTLPIFGKLFEKVIYSRLYDYLVKKNILYDNQYGFRKSHSCSYALNYSASAIQKYLENDKHVIGIFINLSKAFDTIEHTKLLQKLNIQYLFKTTGHFAQRMTIVFACKYSIAQLYCNHYAQAGTFNDII